MNKNQITKYDEIAKVLEDISDTFDRRWRECYQYYPETINLSYEDRQKWEMFTFRVIDDLVGHINLEEMCNVSYATGRKEGIVDKGERIQETINKLKSLIDNM